MPLPLSLSLSLSLCTVRAYASSWCVHIRTYARTLCTERVLQRAASLRCLRALSLTARSLERVDCVLVLYCTAICNTINPIYNPCYCRSVGGRGKGGTQNRASWTQRNIPRDRLTPLIAVDSLRGGCGNTGGLGPVRLLPCFYEPQIRRSDGWGASTGERSVQDSWRLAGSGCFRQRNKKGIFRAVSQAASRHQ